ncbi:MAG: 50S ribosomal protein L1 [Bacilli bacterium]
MKKYGKKYNNVLKLIDTKKVYSVEEACELIKKTSVTKFDSSVGVSMHLNINAKAADQQIRGTVILPAGTGKNVRVVALTSKVEEAKAAGADYAGGEELLNKIVNEKWFDFDVICATPEMMGHIGKAGRVLGPKGLMPNPKTGTVGPDVKKMVSEAKAGKVEYRADKDGNVNLAVGKVSFDTKKLVENVNTVIQQILKIKPASIKGAYVTCCVIHTTMGPSVKVVCE